VSKAGKLAVVVLLVASVHAVLTLLWGRSDGDFVRIAQLGPVHFDLVNVRNVGRAFGLFSQPGPSRAMVALFQSFFAVGLALLFLSLVDRRHTLQLVALGGIVSASLVSAGEQVIRGYSQEYFDLGLGPHRFPTFNVAEIAGWCGWLLLYGLVVLRFFRRLTEPDDKGSQDWRT
jgi:lipoprotein signal peptidase